MNIFTELPVFDDLKNQTNVINHLTESELFELKENKKTGNIYLSGFPASAPDLGWIVKKIQHYWKTRDMPEEQFEQLIKEEMWMVVNRILTLDVYRKISTGNKFSIWLEVSFTTKDDNSVYSYSFSTGLQEK